MGRSRSPNRDKAFEIYKEHEGNISPKELSEQLKEKTENIYRWKTLDEWDYKIHKKKGAPKGNNRAAGNKGGAPKGNKNAKKTEKKKNKGGQKGNLNGIKHGLYCDPQKRLPDDFVKKWFPIGFKKAYEDSVDTGISKLDKLGHSIDMLWAKILVSQKITAVKNKKDLTKELKREKYSPGKFGDGTEEEYELQFAWDKENAALDTYSKAMERLGNMIDKYEKLLHANWELATEEQKLRIDKIRADLSKGNKSDEPINIVISRKSKE